MTVALAVAGAGALAWDYVATKRELRAMAATLRSTDGDRTLAATVESRLAAITGEIATWRDLYARIVEPLSRMDPASARTRGVGGGAAPVPDTVAEATAPAAPELPELDRIRVSAAEDGRRLRELQRFVQRVREVLASFPSRWPVRGGVNSPFGMRASPWSGSPEFHRGIDIAADRGTPVVAPADGVVAFAGHTQDYGNAVILEHGPDVKTVFGHLQTVQVARGRRVARGETIALTGSTGRSTGPHLHYEVVVKGRPVNPRNYLWE
jgi:murein DD-endopeptidase MepM/ murein hydrolase activator NlpD